MPDLKNLLFKTKGQNTQDVCVQSDLSTGVKVINVNINVNGTQEEPCATTAPEESTPENLSDCVWPNGSTELIVPMSMKVEFGCCISSKEHFLRVVMSTITCVAMLGAIYAVVFQLGAYKINPFLSTAPTDNSPGYITNPFDLFVWSVSIPYLCVLVMEALVFLGMHAPILDILPWVLACNQMFISPVYVVIMANITYWLCKGQLVPTDDPLTVQAFITACVMLIALILLLAIQTACLKSLTKFVTSFTANRNTAHTVGTVVIRYTSFVPSIREKHFMWIIHILGGCAVQMSELQRGAPLEDCTGEDCPLLRMPALHYYWPTCAMLCGFLYAISAMLLQPYNAAVRRTDIIIRLFFSLNHIVMSLLLPLGLTWLRPTQVVPVAVFAMLFMVGISTAIGVFFDWAMAKKMAMQQSSYVRRNVGLICFMKPKQRPLVDGCTSTTTDLLTNTTKSADISDAKDVISKEGVVIATGGMIIVADPGATTVVNDTTCVADTSDAIQSAVNIDTDNDVEKSASTEEAAVGASCEAKCGKVKMRQTSLGAFYDNLYLYSKGHVVIAACVAAFFDYNMMLSTLSAVTSGAPNTPNFITFFYFRHATSSYYFSVIVLVFRAVEVYCDMYRRSASVRLFPPLRPLKLQIGLWYVVILLTIFYEQCYMLPSYWLAVVVPTVLDDLYLYLRYPKKSRCVILPKCCRRSKKERSADAEIFIA